MKPPLSPLKPKRSAGENRKRVAGGFIEVVQGETVVWICEKYHLYKADSMSSWNKRDLAEWEKDRKDFLGQAIRHNVDGCDYYVVWNCSLVQSQREKLLWMFHNGKTKTMKFGG